MRSSVREGAHEQMSSPHCRIATYPSPPPTHESPSPSSNQVQCWLCRTPIHLPALGTDGQLTLRDDSVVFVLVQSPDQGVLAAIERTKEAGSAGAAGDPEGPEELAVLLVGERCSWLLCLSAPKAVCVAPTQEHW